MRKAVLMVFGCLVLLILIIITWRASCQTLPRVSAPTLLETAQTGDLLYFRSRRRAWYYLAVVPMTHIGVILRHKGRPYVLEMHQFNDAPPGYPNLDGPHVYPLDVRLNEALYQDGDWDLFYSRYRGPPVLNIDLTWAFPPAYVPYNYSYIRNEITCHALLKIPRVNTSQKMHCANYAAWVVKKLGIVPPQARIDCVFPLDVRELGPYGQLEKVVT